MGPIKELPHDLLAEKSLIGCLLVDGASFDEVSDLKIVAEDFHHPQYGVLFDAISDLATANKPIDYVTVCSTLAERGKLEMIGGQTAVMNILEEHATAANVYHYGKIVKDKSSLRQIIRTSMQVTDMGLTHTGKVEDFIQEVEGRFFKLTNEAKSNGMVKLSLCLKENLKELEDESREPGAVRGLPTGYKKLDEVLLGMQAGQLIILAARPAMGKTAFVLNIAQNASSLSGLPVAIFSLEMTRTELSMRLLSQRSKVDSKRMRTKNFLRSDFTSISRGVKELNDIPIMINDSGNVTVMDILSQCRKIKAEHGLGLIIIDYLQLLTPHTGGKGGATNREQQISEMSRALKGMAKELNCPIIALSQLNRQLESRVDKRPMTSDLRESGSIEQDADMVMFIYRDEVYNPDTKEPGVAEIIVAKNRGGETGRVKLAWLGSYTSFENLGYDAPVEHA